MLSPQGFGSDGSRAKLIYPHGCHVEGPESNQGMSGIFNHGSLEIKLFNN